MKIRRVRRKRPGGGCAARQSGYMLVVILFMLAIMMIALTEVAPSIAQQIRRDREEELMHRGTQYARAIKRFYKKFGRYPMRLEDLENTNNLRFLRKRYKDPVTGSDEWRLIHVGEAKITPKVFATPGGGQTSPLSGAAPAAGQPSPAGSPGAAGLSAILGPGSVTPSQPTGMGTPVSQMPGASGTSGPTLGGGPIIGVSSTSEKESIKEMDSKNHYNEWEFVYDPRFDVDQGVPGGAVVPPGTLSPTAQPGGISPMGQPMSPGATPAPRPK